MVVIADLSLSVIAGWEIAGQARNDGRDRSILHSPSLRVRRTLFTNKN